jgi:hypothetical protein
VPCETNEDLREHTWVSRLNRGPSQTGAINLRGHSCHHHNRSRQPDAWR